MLIQLEHLNMMEKLLKEYYDHSPAALVPGPLVLPAFSALQYQMIDISSPSALGRVESDRTILQTAESVVQSTSRNINIDLT